MLIVNRAIGLTLTNDNFVVSVIVLLISKKKSIDKKVLRKHKIFSTRLSYANKK